MTQVTETITRPGGAASAGAQVRYDLVGAERAFVSADDETVVGRQPTIIADVNGEYTLDLPPNVGLNPAGTRWRRTVVGAGFEPFFDDIIVPSGGGPFVLEDILAAPVVPIPQAEPSNELDVAEITANTSALALGGALALTAVPGLIVTVPDVERPVWLEADCSLQPSATGTDTLAIAPVGSTGLTQALGGQNITLAAGVGQGAFARARLAPSAPGDYQVFVAGVSGTMIVVAAAFAPARLTALQV